MTWWLGASSISLNPLYFPFFIPFLISSTPPCSLATLLNVQAFFISPSPSQPLTVVGLAEGSPQETSRWSPQRENLHLRASLHLFSVVSMLVYLTIFLLFFPYRNLCQESVEISIMPFYHVNKSLCQYTANIVTDCSP